MKLITNTDKNCNTDNYNIEEILNDMVDCHISKFIIGSPINELGREDNEYQKNIIISIPFKICKYPVTQKQYEYVMNCNPSFNKKNENAPVETINWYEAKEFCQKLNQILKSDLPVGYKFDLPTEIQWEYACRAESQQPLFNGKCLSVEDGFCPNVDEIAWYFDNSDFNTHPVGLKKPNNWGIFDMLGNVWEWCVSSIEYDLKCNITDNDTVIKGGCYRSKAKKCRCAKRSIYNKNMKSDKIGFRLALVSRFNVKNQEILKLPQEENDDYINDKEVFTSIINNY